MENILQRIKLLMEYDNSKTYSENLLIIEQGTIADDVIKFLGGFTNKAGKTFGKNAADDIVKLSNIPGISTFDDLVKNAGTIQSINLGRINTQIVKSSVVPFASKTVYLDKIVAANIKAGKGVGKTVTEMTDEFVKKGFGKREAEYLSKRLHARNVKTGSTPAEFNRQSKAAGNTPAKSAGKTKNSAGRQSKKKKTNTGKNKNFTTNNQSPPPVDASKLDKLKEYLKLNPNINWKKLVAWTAGIGIPAIALWHIFFNSENNPETEDLQAPDDTPITDNALTDNSTEESSGGGGGGTSGGNYAESPTCEQVQKGEATMSRGVMGNCVELVQSKLNDVNSAGLRTDSKFGERTEKAVKAFQLKNQMDESGIVDQATYNKLFGGATTGSDYEEAPDNMAGADEEF